MAIVDSRLTAAMIGAAIGDAMGLPVQGETQAALVQNPVTAMRGYGHFGLPAGYYSDETAMNLATMAALTHGFDPRRILNEYRRWAETFEYAAYTGPIVDIWPSVQRAIAGQTLGTTINEPTGLVRVLPMAYYLFARFGQNLFTQPLALTQLHAFVALTATDDANQIAASLYAQLIMQLLADHTLTDALAVSLAAGLAHWQHQPAGLDFQVLTQLDAQRAAVMAQAPPTPRNILGVVWYALQTGSDYRSRLLTAVNLGGRADATGALTGGAAGLAGGYIDIPHKWCLTLTRYGDIVRRVRLAEQSGAFG